MIASHMPQGWHTPSMYGAVMEAVTTKLAKLHAGYSARPRESSREGRCCLPGLRQALLQLSLAPRDTRVMQEVAPRHGPPPT